MDFYRGFFMGFVAGPTFCLCVFYAVIYVADWKDRRRLLRDYKDRD